MVTPVLPENRYGLAIHTASADLGLAICRLDSAPATLTNVLTNAPSDVESGSGFESGDWRCQTWAIGREVSRYLHAYLSEFLAPQTWTDLALIAVAKGPGGFTGTRLGVVTARTLAQQLKLPLFAVSTLAAVAWTERQSGSGAGLGTEAPAPDIAVQMPAQRGELYGAIYASQPNVPPDLLPDLPPDLRPDLPPGQPNSSVFPALRPDAVMSLQQWQAVLAAWPRSYRLVQAEGHLGFTAASLLEIARLDWQRGLRPHWSEAMPFYGQSPV